MITIKSLRQAGNKVRVTHRRRVFDNVNRRWSLLTKHEHTLSQLDKVPVDAKGGVTEIELTTKNGKTITGIAECSKKDGFNRKFGVIKALGRVLSDAHSQNVSLP